MIFDTHCHLNFSAFKQDVKSILQTNLNNEIWVVIVGSNKKTSERAIELAKLTEKGIYCTVGLHPVHITKQIINEGGADFISKGEKFSARFYKNLVKKSLHHKKFLSFLRRKTYPGKVVAIGETGLDYQYGKTKKIRAIQEKVFVQHMQLADELQLPLMIHARGDKKDKYKVYDDLIHILEKERMSLKAGLHGIVHSFYGTYEQAQQFISMGLLLGINTHLNLDEKLMKVVRMLDLKDLVLETDSPYFHPSGDENKRNEPKNVNVVCEVVAKLHNKTIYEVATKTTQNALHLFKIMN